MHLGTASYEDLLRLANEYTIEGETIRQMPFEVKGFCYCPSHRPAVGAYVQGLAKVNFVDKPELPYLMAMEFFFS